MKMNTRIGENNRETKQVGQGARMGNREHKMQNSSLVLGWVHKSGWQLYKQPGHKGTKVWC